MTTLYEDLGIEQTDDQRIIKTAYRSKAQKHHPDKDGGDNELFLKVKHAFEVLSNPQRKKVYDEYGLAHGDIHIIRDAQQIVVSVFEQIIDADGFDPEVVPLVQEMTRHLMNMRQKARTQQSAVEKKINLRKAALKRLIKKGEEDFIITAMATKLSALEQEEAKFKVAVATFDMAVELSHKFDYKVEVKVMRHVGEVFGSGTSSGFTNFRFGP